MNLNLSITAATRVGLNVLALLGAVLALRLGEAIFIPTVMAVMLAAILWPATRWLTTRGIPVPGLTLRGRFPWIVPCVIHWRLSWGFACMAVIGGLVLLVLVLTLAFAVAVNKMLQDIPLTPEGQAQLYEDFRDQVAKISPVPLDDNYLPKEAARSRIFQYVQETLSAPVMTQLLWRVTWYANSWMWQSVLIMFILLFLLLEGRMLTQRIVEIFGPSPEARAKAVEALSDMAFQLRNFLVWRTLVNFGLALVVGLVYQALELRQAWTWALLTAVLCYIPYLGPILAGIPPLLDAFLTTSPWVALGVLVFYVAVVTLEGYVVVPMVMGRGMDLNATTVMLACVFWELVWGPVGLFMAMPLMAAIKAICTHVPGWKPWANLMSTKEADEPPEPEPVLAVARPIDADATVLIEPRADSESAKKSAAGRERI